MTLDRQPRLIGESLELRPLRAEDFEALFAVASDPLIWQQHPESDRYQEKVFRRFFADALESGGALVALDRSSGKIIGSSRFHGYDPSKGVVEIGWTFLGRDSWGGRTNGEMKRLMLQHAFQSVQKVIFRIGPENIRSQKAVEKIGGTFTKKTTDSQGEEIWVYELTPEMYSPPENA
jgi:RimJ/RimL family protein N-acetyltransferase